MSSELGVVVSIRVKPGMASEQIAVFNQLAPIVRAEDGCVAYDLHRVDGDEDRFVLLEKWRSREALAAHESTPHMLKAGAASPSFRAEPAIVTILGSPL